MRYLTQLPGSNQLSGILHQRRPPVVVSDKGTHSATVRCTLDFGGLLRVSTDRFLAKNVFTGFGCSLHDFQMQVIGCRDAYRLDFGIRDQFLPARHPP